MTCKQHCPCYLEALKQRSKGGKLGAAITNSNYSTEKRREAGKKAWANRKKQLEKAADQYLKDLLGE